jgi:hypothetical protein
MVENCCGSTLNQPFPIKHLRGLIPPDSKKSNFYFILMRNFSLTHIKTFQNLKCHGGSVCMFYSIFYIDDKLVHVCINQNLKLLCKPCKDFYTQVILYQHFYICL